MTIMKLESVDSQYDIANDRLLLQENYTPGDGGMLHVEGDCTSARLRLHVTAEAWKHLKGNYDAAGVIVRNGAGAIIPAGKLS